MERLPQLTGVRSLAWVLVAGFHAVVLYDAAAQYLGVTGNAINFPTSKYLLGMGFLGVDLFFVLSGFLIIGPLTSRPISTTSQLKGYAFSRFWRIVPTYYLSILAIGIWAIFEPNGWFRYSLIEVVRHLLFLQASNPSSFMELNMVYWSIAVELQFYLLAPLLALGFSKNRWKFWLPVSLILTLAFRALVWDETGNRYFEHFQVHTIPAFAFHFALGATLGTLFARGKRATRGNLFALVGLLLALVIPLLLWGSEVAKFGNETTSFSIFARPISAIGFALLLWGLTDPRGIATKIFSMKFPVVVGEWSYSLYLIHLPIQFWLINHVQGLFEMGLFVTTLVTVSGALVIGGIFYFVAERPFLRNAPAIRLKLAKFIGDSGNRIRDWNWKLIAGMGTLVSVAMILRIPYRSKYLATWDSVLFALGVERYDVLDARPHPPGYPVYVGIVKLFHSEFWDVNTTMVAISLAFFCMATIAIVLLGRQFGSASAGWAAGILFSLSPIALYDSLIATTYVAEAFFSAIVALLSIRAFRTTNNLGIIVCLGIIFALAVGVRQSMFLFLVPLVVYTAILAPGNIKFRLKRISIAGAASAIVAIGWFVPMIQLSGGYTRYQAATELQTTVVVFANTIWNNGPRAFDDLLPRFALYIQYEAWVLLPVALLAGLLFLMRRKPQFSMISWWIVWTLPSLVFYLTIFNGWGVGPAGYIMVLSPAIYVGATSLIRGATKGIPSPHNLSIFCAIILVAGIPLAAGWPDATEELRSHDEWTANWLQLNTDSRFDPATTGIISSYSWAHVKWHHPDHVLFGILNIPSRDGPWFLGLQSQNHEDVRSFYDAHLAPPNHDQIMLPEGMTQIVIFDFQLVGENGGTSLITPGLDIHEEFLENGWRIVVLEIPSGVQFLGDLFQYPLNTLIPQAETNS